MSLSTYPVDTPILLPKLGSWPPAVHVFAPQERDALLAAEAANRPLLVRGEPGTGKSQLARAAAVARGRLVLSVVVNARTECQDLQWHFDAVGRVGEAQILAYAHARETDMRQYLQPRRFLTPGPLWWVFDWDSALAQYQACASPAVPIPPHPEGWQPSHGS